MRQHRLATPDDLDAVHAIYVDPRVSPYLGHDPMSRDAFVPILAKLVDEGAFRVVVDDAGAVQGFYRAVRHEGRARHVGYLGTLAVAPSAHGSGLAKAMVETAIEGLAAEGVVRVELMLEADNPRALAFYRKLGFVLEGTMRAAYQRSGDAGYVDELFMAKLLPPLEDAS